MPEKILIVQTAFIGDIVLTTPLIKAVKEIYPRAKLSFLTTPKGKELVEDIEELDEIIAYDKKEEDKGIIGLIKLVRAIRARGFDLSLTPHQSYRTALLLFLADIPIRIGYKESSFSFLYNRKVHWNPKIHQVERAMLLLEALGEGRKNSRNPYLNLSPVVEQEAQVILEQAGIKKSDLVVGVSPGSVWATKRWIPEGYGELITQLNSIYGAKVLILGGPEDREVVKEVMFHCEVKPINLTEQSSLKQLVALIDRCELFVGNDSGPMHIAVARGVPVIAIFGPTTPELGFSPYSTDSLVIQQELDCRPCGLHGSRRCPEKHFKCMSSIPAEEVLEAAGKFLRKPRGERVGGSPY
ncbi:MAG: lipopolysaccharide heptosyltransferase II [Deltaproteobacteria bacterium]|nr:MAG: lipopolysaccharide heptosyltransferase II [Deltaproteobacteria bacterium]